MRKKSSVKPTTGDSKQKLVMNLRTLSHQILDLSMKGFLRVNFLREVSGLLLKHAKCDVVEIRIVEDGSPSRFEYVRCDKREFRFKLIPFADKNLEVICTQQDKGIERLCRVAIKGNADSFLPFCTGRGSFWSGCISDLINDDKDYYFFLRDFKISKRFESFALIPLLAGNKKIGILQIMCKKKHFFTKETIVVYENFAQELGFILMGQKAQAALQERVKELTCLYGIARVVEMPGVSLDKILDTTVNLLPPAWQYPEITHGRIILDGKVYTSKGFKDGGIKQSSDIVVNGKKRGIVEVAYSKIMYDLDEGPFLKEERNLIDTIARELSLIVERRQTEEEKVKLQNQLRHADRLATIGQLAAGVAHELNEPLGNILGFAQLLKKSDKLDNPVLGDIGKIEKASLHAREVIRKLLIFARQLPTKKVKVNLNQIIEEGLYFLESRCAKEGIKLVRTLDSELPEVTADPAQLTQVLVNLVVNAIQAMPDGGILTIVTKAESDNALLIVEDTGIGMDKKMINRIFLPFFTTKEVGQGTGLGLPVVHGIVTSHGGTIKVESNVGKGSRFIIRFPLREKDLTED